MVPTRVWARRMSSWWTKNSRVFHTCSTPGTANGTTHGERNALDEHAEVGPPDALAWRAR